MDQRARVRTRPVGAPDDIELGPTVVQLGPQGGGLHRHDCRHHRPDYRRYRNSRQESIEHSARHRRDKPLLFKPCYLERFVQAELLEQ